MHVRLAGVDDLETLARIEQEVFASGYPIVVFRQFLEILPGLVFVAENDGVPCGYVIGAPTHPDGPSWLLSLAVLPEAEGMGVARLLVETLMGALVGTGAREMRLTVDPDTEGAVAFYTKLGFVEVARDDAYFGPGYPRAVLSRPLGGKAAPA